MLRKRLGILVGLLMIGSLASAGPILAAAPSNDLITGKQTISVGFSGVVDTTQATTDSDDLDIAAGCFGVPALDASVWYAITPATNIGIVIDMSTSTYSAGAIVATGGPGNWTVETCGPGAVVWSAAAGVTYTVLVFDDQQDGAGNGGTLNISVAEAPPPPEVSLTVNPRGTFNAKTGSATIRGTVTCTGASVFSFIDVFVRQKVGRLFIDGGGFIEGFTCNGTTQAWSVEVFPFNGIFKGGSTVTVTFAVACGAFQCGVGFDQSVVRLSARR